MSRIEHLRLRDLLILERVHELGSLRQVADSLHLTQPAVTQALQSVEDAFGAQLVVRSSSGATLSSTGLAVLARLKAMRWEAMAARDIAHRPAHPTVTLGVNQSAATEFVPRAVAAFVDSEAGVRVDLKELNSPALWQSLADAKVDAIVCRMLAAEAFDRLSEGIAYDVIATERMVLVAAVGHPLLEGEFDKAQLARQSWVLPPSNSYARHALNEWFQRADIPSPVATITSESYQTNIRLAGASRLLTVVPANALANYRGRADVAAVPIDTDWEGFSTVFAYRQSSLANPVMQALRKHFLDLGWSA